MLVVRIAAVEALVHHRATEIGRRRLLTLDFAIPARSPHLVSSSLTLSSVPSSAHATSYIPSPHAVCYARDVSIRRPIAQCAACSKDTSALSQQQATNVVYRPNRAWRLVS